MQIAKGTLVLVADGKKMLLLRNDGDAKYPVLATRDHAETADPASRELGTDTPGRTHASSGEGRSAYEETDWHQQAEDRFAREVSTTLNDVTAREDGGIIVIAAAKTLGTLRKHYGAAVQQRLLAEIDKDLTGHSSDHIATVIAAHEP